MLPDLSLTAVVSDREINLNPIGRKTVLVFHGQDPVRAALGAVAIRALQEL